MKFLTMIVAALLLAAPAGAAEKKAQLLGMSKVWGTGGVCAYTDLAWMKGQWWCVFREGASPLAGGVLRVMSSTNGQAWKTAAVLSCTNSDLREGRLTETPEGRMMLSAGLMFPPRSGARFGSLAWFSEDGRAWGEPVAIGGKDDRLWRMAWNKGTCYSAAYHSTDARYVRLYASTNGVEFKARVPQLYAEGFPNEAALVFQPDDQAVCLLRRDGQPRTALLGLAPAPYTNWVWKDLGTRVGTPQMARLGDGRIVAAGRFYDGSDRTALAWVDPAAGSLTEFLRLPSGGETGGPGMVWKDGELWVSYHSSHEGKTAVYLARVKLP